MQLATPLPLLLFLPTLHAQNAAPSQPAVPHLEFALCMRYSEDTGRAERCDAGPNISGLRGLGRVLGRVLADGGYARSKNPLEERVEEVAASIRWRIDRLQRDKAPFLSESRKVRSEYSAKLQATESGTVERMLTVRASAARLWHKVDSTPQPDRGPDDARTRAVLDVAKEHQLRSRVLGGLPPGTLRRNGADILDVLRPAREEAFKGVLDAGIERERQKQTGRLSPDTRNTVAAAFAKASLEAAIRCGPGSGDVRTALLVDAAVARQRAVGLRPDFWATTLGADGKLTPKKVSQSLPKDSLTTRVVSAEARNNLARARLSDARGSLREEHEPWIRETLARVDGLLPSSHELVCSGSVVLGEHTLAAAEGVLNVAIGSMKGVPVLENVRGSIADKARSHLREADWAPGLHFSAMTTGYWCNLFVADVLREAGAATWDPIHERVGINPTRDPVAKEWADPNHTIAGWTVVFPTQETTDLSVAEILALRRSGDVVSSGQHVGIVADERHKTIQASATDGAVKLSDWSFELPHAEGFRSAAEYEAAAKKKVRAFTVRRFFGR